ncbi:magnesium transporter ALR1 [Histoplasma capsulatum var. duboisii H88]|uniref:Magnesium transporter ALR1 n=2 Tax=Ajellomyces capsulatus TaxID=5037 RepID=F0UG95_AJEC8|nr:magnesium transporter ALR1 [Histoplasma capsulatum H143]EGC45090.1 magnesium transporter ALR1 [Histoplasma capsulatum var. duboisii H88]QSS55861.1 magnesium transporter ALR1 [Histoplasma capsulatum var. duboisii H88]
MSESPRSDKGGTRFSTPAPELDDHRFQPESLPRADTAADNVLSWQDKLLQARQAQEGGSPMPRRVNDTFHLEVGPISRDFENAIADDELSANGDRRRSSVNPMAPVRPSLQRPNLTVHDLPTRSRASSASGKSSSPPNSVEAFAEPRRRERANTMESHAPLDLDIVLHKTMSTGTNQRRPTFSNTSAIGADTVDPRTGLNDDADVCFPTYDESGKTSIIDFEELEEFVALSRRKSQAVPRKVSMTAQRKPSRTFHDLRPRSEARDIPKIVMRPSTPASVVDTAGSLEKQTSHTVDEKEVKNLHNENERNRFSFFSSEFQNTVHACELGGLVLEGETFRDLFQLGPDGGVWWLDVLDPTNDEVGAISRAFSIHPLTAEDIMMQEAREKVELFKQYYFVCFRTFYQIDKLSDDFLEPINTYMVVFREGIISFSYTENPHAGNVRKRISKLRDYVSLSSDWVCYAMIDDIVDSFGPVLRDVEIESEVIEDQVFIARVEDFNVFLPQIGGLRKKVMSLMRLLGGKADVIKGFSKRCNEQYSVTPRGDIGLYLGDIQDHVVTMMSNLGHFEKMLSRSHTNYLAQLSVTNLMIGNRVNKVLSKITFLATILVPLNLICGLFGMNVPVPGQSADGLGWFFGILGVIGMIVMVSLVIARRYKLL